MKRTPPRRTVADRLLQNIGGITYELEQMRKTVRETPGLFTGGELLLIERALEKLESESEKLERMLENPGDSADPFQAAR